MDWRSMNNGYSKIILMRLATYLPWLISLSILFFSKRPLDSTILGFIMFIAGFAGVIAVIRQEIPTVLYVISGKKAIIEGSIIILLCWGGAIYILLSGR
jgi:hypothetical protein